MSNRTNKPTIGALSFVLRHKELWPHDFFWCFPACASCAMGLAHKIWPDKIPFADPRCVGQAIGIDIDTAASIFYGAGSLLNISNGEVTPEHIADMLDAVA